MYEEFKVEITYLKTGSRVLQMSTTQGVVMIRIAPLRSQEANAMVTLSCKCLNWPGEVKMQTLFFGYGGYGKWCYSSGIRMGMSCI